MYQFDVERTVNHKSTVHLFYFCVILMLGVGLVTLYSASYSFAERFFRDGYYFFIRQLIFGVIGIAAFFVFAQININIVRKFTMPLVFIAAGLCVLTLIPGIGIERYGASRWIEVGSMSYQPSEMVKFVLPLYLAHIFDKKANSQEGNSNFNNLYTGVLPPVLVTGLFFVLIYLQNNFSTAV
ncbi:MAG: FtsW/RodA/SpoVE family cell cycle protein, partial [Treponema sp.]|nr:FtsW/RodA/SpoVE family cell cycle protein [Treponema sp.]